MALPAILFLLKGKKWDLGVLQLEFGILPIVFVGEHIFLVCV